MFASSLSRAFSQKSQHPGYVLVAVPQRLCKAQAPLLQVRAAVQLTPFSTLAERCGPGSNPKNSPESGVSSYQSISNVSPMSSYTPHQMRRVGGCPVGPRGAYWIKTAPLRDTSWVRQCGLRPPHSSHIELPPTYLCMRYTTLPLYIISFLPSAYIPSTL